jgi:Ca-activated chloride channel family protein
MSDDDFNGLSAIQPPEASAEAKRRAIGASLMAFDAAEAAGQKESAIPPQGLSLIERLKSIVPHLKGSRIMDARLSIGTAALVLVLLPLGYQLYSTTALTPPPHQVDIKVPVTVATTTPPAQRVVTPSQNAITTGGGLPGTPTVPAGTIAGKDESGSTLTASMPAPTSADLAKPEPKPVPVIEKPSALAKTLNEAPAQLAGTTPPVDADTSSVNAPTDALAAAPVPEAAAAQSGIVSDGEADLALAPSAAKQASGGIAMDRMLVAPAPAIGVRQATTPTGDKFANFAESAQKAVSTDPVSTFSIDVDTASYSYMRRSLQEGRIPEPDAVRVEELLNYFPYDYPAAASADTPFRPTIAVFPTPWNTKTELMQIGIKGYEPPASARPVSNLVFLIDTSGSMDEPDKLPLLQRALTLLVNTLPADDTVSIVSYAGAAGVVLEPTKASDKTRILTALDNLEAGGSTAGAEGIELAYQLAEAHKLQGGNNRVILATDGDFNVGISDPAALKTFIKAKRQSGISLSVLGFGEGNLDDETMQTLAQNGDGNASYIDTLSEAQKVLVKEAGSTLDTIAKDVKIQVEFNPATVSSYRLIGYETRVLKREDFNNDKVDAGDVGAGHTVTALYEITPAGAGTPPVDALRYGANPAATPTDGKGGELADFKLRYKLPGSDNSRLIEQPVGPSMVVDNIANASTDARWAAAVAAFGQKLRGSDYAGTMSYADIGQLARGARGADADGYRSEFINLVGLASALTGTDTDTDTSGSIGKPMVN